MTLKNKLLISSNCIEIQCERDDTATQQLLTDFYPVTSNRIKTSFKLSPHLVPEVLKAFRNLDEGNIHTAPQKIQDLFYRELLIRENTLDLLTNGPRQSSVVSSRLTLKTHQQLGRELAEYHDRFAFFYDTRTGKTPLSLTIIYDDLRKNPNHKWLVVCPLILIYNAWLEDAAKFFPELATVNCHADTPQKRMKAIETPGNIYLTNTESFVKYRGALEPLGFTGCIVDESSDMKSPRSKVSQELVDFAQYVNRFYLLAGTPAPNGEWEYYMQMRAIDYYGWHSSYSQFKEYYFVNMSYNPQYEKLSIRPDRKDELLENVKRKALYVDKDDVLDTPGREFIPVEYDMPKTLLSHYRKLKNELYLELGDNIRITAINTGAKLNKLNQVSSGFVMDTQAAKENKLYDTDLAEWYLLDNTRFEVLQDLLNQDGIKGEQVLIWANYRREFELIQGILGDRCACVYGGVNLDEKNEAIKRFKAGDVQYLIANPASADKGLTLTNAHIAIYFSLNWSYETFKQSYDRIYGGKDIQPYFCRYYILIAKHTIDNVLYTDVLQGKGDASYAVLNHLKGGLTNETDI